MYKIMNSKKCDQQAIINDVVSSMKNGNTFNLPGVLEILNNSTDNDVQVKLISILSAYIMLNTDNIKTIVTYNPIYDIICKILANSPTRKTTIAFNFISALLYADEEDSHRKNSLVAYARNMIRSSGCLATMCDLFTTCMMHQDAWRALCRCLAESCRGIEANQSYCTHLVPMCIQRCSQRNIEVLQVLQSLLHNHTRNINLFVECNGMSLFQREFLQHDICLQLLATIAQCSTAAAALIINTDVCQQLRDFLQMYGPQSQLGQWATIVLYHTSKVEALRENSKIDEEIKDNNKLSESLLMKLQPFKQNQEKEYTANTTTFLQNVMKEIILCGAQKEIHNVKSFFPTDIMMKRNTAVDYVADLPFHNTSHRKTNLCPQDPKKFYANDVKRTVIKNDSLQLNRTNELSLSFLRKQYLDTKHFIPKYVTANKVSNSFQKTFQTNNTINKVQTNAYESMMENSESPLDTLGTNEFQPKFASTPKKDNLNKYSMYEKPVLKQNSGRLIQKSIRKHQIKGRLQKKRVAKHLERSKVNKEIKHRSFSGRFFDAINTSCTTLVKTVKNIFRPKSDLHETKDEYLNNTPNRDTMSCSYSFTNYMRRRDAVLNNDATNRSCDDLVDFNPKENNDEFSLEMSNSCNTCNDTISLKRKLEKDDRLKQTVRKLKLGINLYGCNFKKISRIMWPKESYMTPAVLYNLYRKLIIK